VQTPILGNVKVFFTDGAQAKQPQKEMSIEELDDDVPF
jgi:hypothetical protein